MTRRKTFVLLAIGTLFAWLAYAQTQPGPGRLAFVLLEGVVFGSGLVFVASAWPAMRDSTTDRRGARLAYLAIAYVLLTWTLVDTLVVHTGIAALDLFLHEHVYHATVVGAGALVARYGARLVRERQAQMQAARVGDA